MRIALAAIGSAILVLATQSVAAAPASSEQAVAPRDCGDPSVVDGTEGQWGGMGWGRGYKRDCSDSSSSAPASPKDDSHFSSPAVVDGTEGQWGGMGWGRGYAKDKREAKPEASQGEVVDGTEGAWAAGQRGYVKRESDVVEGTEGEYGLNRGYAKRQDPAVVDGTEAMWGGGPIRGYVKEKRKMQADVVEGTEGQWGAAMRGYAKDKRVKREFHA